MKITSAVFQTSAANLAGCPAPARPEFAFIGRSNVGKSSLINLLTGQRALAKVSDLPGKTKLINFFTINQQWSLVDLPGYGYAKTSQAERDKFNHAVAEYLEKRPSVVTVFALLDARLPPQAIDQQFLYWAGEVGLPLAVVFTKADKQSGARTRQQVEQAMSFFGAHSENWPPHFITSAETGDGRQELLGYIEQQLAAAKPMSPVAFLDGAPASARRGATKKSRGHAE